MKIKVCVGSSCHLKGSYDVIEEMTKLIKKYQVEDKIELVASFCLGHCIDGVTVQADEYFLHNVSKENLEEIFIKEIYPKLDK